MKTIIFYLMALISILLIGCVKDGTETFILPPLYDSISTKDASRLQNALNIPNSHSVSGNMPSTAGSGIFLTNGQPTVTINSGGNLIVPILYNSVSQIQSVFFQIIGADGTYYQIKPVIVQGTDGYAYFIVQLPDILQSGNFQFSYAIADTQGNVSNYIQISVEVLSELLNCSNAYVTGESGLTFTTLYMGAESGLVEIFYNTYSVPDRIDVYQNNYWLTGTGTNPNAPIPPMCDCDYVLPGFVGRSGMLSFNYVPNEQRTITVIVSGCLNGGTFWEWNLVTAPGCD